MSDALFESPTHGSGSHEHNNRDRRMEFGGVEPNHNPAATLGTQESNVSDCGLAIAMLSHRNSMDVGKHPAFDNDHAAPLIQILTWLFLAFSSLSIIAHFATKKAMSRPTTKGDLILLAALFLGAGQAIAFLSPAGQAIGNSQTDMSDKTIMQAWKALYSGEILSVLTLVAAKGFLLVPFTTVTPVERHRRMMFTVCAVTVAWGLSAVLLIAFQCPPPQRWDISNPQCLDIRAIRTYNASMNIITDLALATIPTLMVLPLQITSNRRTTLLIGFWCRIIVVIASAVQIVYIQALASYTNLLTSIWRVVVCGQVVQVTSILTATVPFLKPFLTSLESGFLGANTASTTATSIRNTMGKTVHSLSYVRLGSSRKLEQFKSEDQRGDIWVRMEYVVQRESRLGATQTKDAENTGDKS